MRVKIKVERKMSKIGTTGFGSEDGGCLGAPFPKLSLSMREKMRNLHDFLI